MAEQVYEDEESEREKNKKEMTALKRAMAALLHRLMQVVDKLDKKLDD